MTRACESVNSAGSAPGSWSCSWPSSAYRRGRSIRSESAQRILEYAYSEVGDEGEVRDLVEQQLTGIIAGTPGLYGAGVDHYAGRRRGCRNLTDPQAVLAVRLAARAEALRAEAGRDGGEGLSVADAVALAAVQLGLQPPTPDA